MTNLITTFFLIAGIVAIILASAGIVLMPTIYSKLHFLSLASAVGVSSIVLAILISEGFNQAGIKSILLGAILLISNSLLSHATGRAGRIRTFDNWQKTSERKKK